MRTNGVPIYSASIATNYLGDVLKRQGFGVDPKLRVELGVHLVLGEPEAEHGHFVREVEQFDAVELAETDDAVIHEQDFALGRTLALQGEDVHFEETQRLVGDNQEVTAAAGGVEKLHAAHAPKQSLALALHGLALIVELPVAQRPDIPQLALLFVKFV